MFLYDEPQAEYECFECMEKENRLDEVKYWFRAILDQLYGAEEFNPEKLEDYLQELASYIGMSGKPFLRTLSVTGVRKNRTVEKTTEMLEEWKTLNNQYLTTLAKTGT